MTEHEKDPSRPHIRSAPSRRPPNPPSWNIARAFRDRRQWVVPVAWVWCASVWWSGSAFLKDLNNHSAAEFYWYLWRQ